MPGAFRSTFPNGHVRVDTSGQTVIAPAGQKVKVSWAWAEGGNQSQRLTSADGSIVYFDSSGASFISGFEAQDGLRIEIVNTGALAVFFWKP